MERSIAPEIKLICNRGPTHYGIAMGTSYFDNYFQTLTNRLSDIATNTLLEGVGLIKDAREAGAKVILAGNGGSAAMASHVTVDLLKCANVHAINFNEADLITCFANDYGYAHWVEEALKVYGAASDLAILISSSGQSENMLNAAKEARQQGMKVMTLSGFNADNPLRSLGDLNLWVDSSHYNTVEMAHHIWLLSMVDFIAEPAD